MHLELGVGGGDEALVSHGVDQVRLRAVRVELEGEVEPAGVRDEGGPVPDHGEAAFVRGHVLRGPALEVVLLDDAALALAVAAARRRRPPDHGAAPDHQPFAGEPHRHEGPLVRRRQHEAPFVGRRVLVLAKKGKERESSSGQGQGTRLVHHI